MSTKIKKPSKIELRARELCVADGINPDAISNRGSHGEKLLLPAWLAYRKAAEDEQKAEPIAMPQPDGYKNAPLTIFGQQDEGTLSQMATCMKVGNVVAGAICADGHLGYAQPVGAVIAYDKQISISGVGFDIGCGNLAVRLDVKYESIKDHVPYMLDAIRRKISFGIGRTNDERVEHPIFDHDELWLTSEMGDYKDKAREQLGTVGAGNHYVDLFEDEAGFVWIGVHFGSRGLGHKTATKYLKAAGGKDGINVPPAVVDVDSEIGERYIAGMTLAGYYAYSGRDWVVNKVRSIVGGVPTFIVHNFHNYAWRETHFGKEFWVVRKGCTPAWPGQYGFIGGSMAEQAVIVKGREISDDAPSLLFSTVHGAGRAYGRKAAKQRFTREEMNEWLQKAGVLLAGGDIDESPMAYKRLSEVLDAHSSTIDIVHRLRPFAVAMAGDSEYDPWKD